MRFIHIADMHFDTPFTFLGEIENLGDLRRIEQREVFKKIIEKLKFASCKTKVDSDVNAFTESEKKKSEDVEK